MKHKRSTTPPLRAVYRTLYAHWGPQHWWPGRTRLEIAVGAILTQNTAWGNVERAIRRLKRERVLTVERLAAVPPARLAEWIRPAGYYRLKAARVKNFIQAVTRLGGLNRLARLPTAEARRFLLEVNGVGPETADSILLYAFQRPVFVIDAYTRRLLHRHAWLDSKADYEEAAALFRERLPVEAPLYNEYHALLVRLGKETCRPKPLCETCPLRRFLPEK